MLGYSCFFRTAMAVCRSFVGRNVTTCLGDVSALFIDQLVSVSGLKPRLLLPRPPSSGVHNTHFHLRTEWKILT